MIDNRAPQTKGEPAGTTERRGFALPMTILVIAFLTVTIAAAYAATSSELTTNLSQRGESRAYMIAQAGLENFIARRNEMLANGQPFCALCGAPPTTVKESTTVDLPGGHAVVLSQQIRKASGANPALYLITSRGIDTINVVNGRSIMNGTEATGALAERTVAMIVYWNVNQVNVLSGWTAGTGLVKKGNSGAVSGVDYCGDKSTVAGIAVPTGGYSSAGGFDPEGVPQIKELGSTQSALQSAMKVDWDGIVNGNRIQADVTFANDAAADAGWDALKVRWNQNPDWFPVVRINGDASINDLKSGGRGTLIVMGNLTLKGNELWHGIILVGGWMDSDGNGTVQGATESGLNALLTPSQVDKANTISSNTITATPGKSTANGTKSFQYNSCDVAKAAGGLASYSVYSNAWMDNFVTY